MTLNQDDERLESYLRQFRPHQPRPLPGRTSAMLLHGRGRTRVGAAAAIIVVSSLFLLLRKPVSPTHPSAANMQQKPSIAQAISLAQLSRAAQRDPAILDAELNSLSARLLPDVRSGHGILKSLARE